MSSSIASLLETGTQLWLDSVDPDLVRAARAQGFTGATSNPVIISALIASGRFDDRLRDLVAASATNEEIAWRLADHLVSDAEGVFQPVWRDGGGDDGYVSFEVDPLLEDPETGPPHDERVARYVELARKWARGHDNRLIKVPATPAGIEALEPIVAAGVNVNVTLIFTLRQYEAARDAVWRGATRLGDRSRFKSVYSVFISRVDVYTARHVSELSPAAQGQVGIVNAKRMWQANQSFWQQHKTPLRQQIVFASTGTKNPDDPPWKYVAALAGSDIQTNPPQTNDAVAESGLTFQRTVDRLPADEVLAEIDAKVDMERLETVLMEEGIAKFAEPQRALLAGIESKRAALR